MPADGFRSFAIFGAMRSGSNLLERFINQFDGLKCHGELFNPAFIGWSGQDNYLGVNRNVRDNSPQDLLSAILENDQANIPGFRIFRDHNRNAIDLFLADETCAKILLTRNPVDSFVSLQIARKTDQWLIHDESHRKNAQIYFDLTAFQDYKKIRKAYSDECERQLVDSAQDFVTIDYTELDDIKKINALAKFIGAKQPLAVLEQSIKRQNPAALADKIVNYDEVAKSLGLPATAKPKYLKPSLDRETGTSLSRMYFCSTQNLVFAPMPSAPDGRIRKWLQAIDDDPPQNNFGPEAFKDWQKGRESPVVFTVLRHPVARAFDVFNRKIFRTGTGSFLAIREALQTRFGVFLPAKGQELDDAGYDVSAHRAAFAQFLAFVNHNLNENTDIRRDGRWISQSTLLAQYRKTLQVDLIAKEEDLIHCRSYVENRLNIKALHWQDVANVLPTPFDLADVYDSDIEALARVAYAKDYAEFGFQNWR